MNLEKYAAAQIVAQLGSLAEKNPSAKIIGIQTNNDWNGASVVDAGNRKFRVCFCRSVLQIRESITELQNSTDNLLVVTQLETAELEQDLLARFAKRRIFPVESWRILLEMFGAREISPRLLKQKWLAEFLLTDFSGEKYPTTPNGVLDEETVWQILLVEKLGFTAARPNLAELLLWTLQVEQVELFKNASDNFKNGVKEWILATVGEPGSFIFSLIEKDFGARATALGLACEIIFAAPQPSELAQAAVRLERYFADQPLTALIARTWFESAASVIEHLHKKQSPIIRQIFLQADEILSEVRAADFVSQSSILPAGLEARLTVLSGAVNRLLQRDDIKLTPEFLQFTNDVFSHRQMLRNTERRQKVEMTVRLIDWLARKPPTEWASFGAAAQSYVAETGLMDRARKAIFHGDTNPSFSAALNLLQKAVTAKREEQNNNFGELIVDWTKSGSTGEDVWRIEDVLREVVAKIAKKRDVLLLVLDGMSFASFHEIMEDLTAHGWHNRIESEMGNFPKPIVAALPSITAVSRTSLLCGELKTGTAADEVRGFANHTELRSISKSKFPPKLFHKASLTAGAALTDELSEAIYCEDQKIVGVVINSIDDHLAKGDQIAFQWNTRSIPALAKLLTAATASNRVVIMISDHGHIIEQNAEYQKADGGERFRKDDENPQTGEFLISGTRVLLSPDHKIIVPWSESIRYAKKKHGYHGGISPQECLVPLAVLSIHKINL